MGMSSSGWSRYMGAKAWGWGSSRRGDLPAGGGRGPLEAAQREELPLWWRGRPPEVVAPLAGRCPLPIAASCWKFCWSRFAMSFCPICWVLVSMPQ